MGKPMNIYMLLTIVYCMVNPLNSYPQPIKGGYYPSWSKTLTPSSIKTKHFTHIYYAFLAPNDTTFKFAVGPAEAPAISIFTSTLRSKNPTVKIMFSVGGASEGSVLFSRLASTLSSRKNFIESSIETARRFGFDGVDLDWEFPETPADMTNLGYLLEEWRSKVEEESKAEGKTPLLLTAAVYYSADNFLSGQKRAYPAGSITRNLDWINVMNYDYHGGWDKTKTGAQAALFDPQSTVSTSYGLQSWINAGVPKEKLVMGLPMYGRTWQLKDPRMFEIGAPAVDVGPGPNKTGVLTYAEVVKYNKYHKAKVVYDETTVSTYSVSNDIWIGFDDAKSVSGKIGYAKTTLGIRGYFFWAVDGDYKWKISKLASQLWSC